MALAQFIDDLMNPKSTSSEDFFEEMTNKNSHLWENPGSADAISSIGVIEIIAICELLNKYDDGPAHRKIIYEGFQALYYDVWCERPYSLSEFLDNLRVKLRNLT
jgi:hypothetical protein